MKLISVNVGLPREITVGGKTVRTSIWKNPVQSRVHVSTLNLDGDRQSDLSVHGGVDKAVYVYPSEHYSYWRSELPDAELPWGVFGENFTSEGILEDQTRIGDRILVGSAEFMVTQPRMPCFKLGIRFNRRDMVKRFLHSKRSGFYLAVIREGDTETGDAIEFTEKQETGVTITDIVNLYSVDSQNQELLRRATELPALPQSWKDYFRKRLWNADA
ncbi:MAG TPA: MOSC domain-containing protein [Candidatus Acidoferrum sp.]|jgi:MOSC domain-containing protein YiiM|nr:MOSC domain-containing protein [Candidatus Acidoferrum sp.]